MQTRTLVQFADRILNTHICVSVSGGFLGASRGLSGAQAVAFYRTQSVKSVTESWLSHRCLYYKIIS